MDRQRRIELLMLEGYRLAIQKLRAEPAKLQVLKETLHRWRRQNGPGRSDGYFDEWERLLAEGIGAIEAATCCDDDRAAVLRSTGPIVSLITAEEHKELLAKCRSL